MQDPTLKFSKCVPKHQLLISDLDQALERYLLRAGRLIKDLYVLLDEVSIPPILDLRH